MGSTSAVPAVCEINGCGVLAIGRCLTCGRAFCGSHQGRGRMQQVPYTNMCAPCMDAQAEAAAKVMAELLAPHLYFQSGTAHADLVASGAKSIALFTIKRDWKVTKTGFFGGQRGEYVDTPQLAGRGWLLGTFKWRCVVHDGSWVVEEHLTALRDQDPNAINTYGLTHVRPCAGGYEDLNLGGRDRLADGGSTEGLGWREAMEAVRRVMGKPN